MTHNMAPEIATPVSPDKMTGFLPIRLHVSEVHALHLL